MFGFHYVKTEPTQFVLQYSGGRLAREGTGLAFWIFAPTTTLVMVDMASSDAPFMFTDVTSDFQEITIQGQVTYRIADPKKLSQLLNFTVDRQARHYVSEDPQKLPQRVINQVQVLVSAAIRSLALRDALAATTRLVDEVRASLRKLETLKSLGLEIIGFSILAIKPVSETARALEASVREQLLKEADEAIYARRNSAVEQERAIKENELNTEIAVENKKRQIRESQMDAEIAVEQKKRKVREAQMDAEIAVQTKQNEIKETDMAAKIRLEEKNKTLVAMATANEKLKADVKAYAIDGVMTALSKVEPKVLQALASTGMEPGQLIAAAFRDLAESAPKIGELNISPDLLQSLLNAKDKSGR